MHQRDVMHHWIDIGQVDDEDHVVDVNVAIFPITKVSMVDVMGCTMGSTLDLGQVDDEDHVVDVVVAAIFPVTKVSMAGE